MSEILNNSLVSLLLAGAAGWMISAIRRARIYDFRCWAEKVSIPSPTFSAYLNISINHRQFRTSLRVWRSKIENNRRLWDLGSKRYLESKSDWEAWGMLVLPYVRWTIALEIYRLGIGD